AQLEATMAFLSALVFFAGVSVGLYYATRNLAGKQIVRLAALEFVGVLGLLTARAAFVANYVNYDLQTEFINYASGAPGVAVVMDQVEEISRRTTDGLGIRVAYDDDTSWPMTWYLRNYTGQVFYGGQPSRETFNDVPLVIAGDSNWSRVEPLLGDQYYSFEYIRMWWPMQDYFGLTWDRIRNAFTDPNYRAALWDIWYARDYTRYGELTNVDYHLSKWPVVDRMRFYVRRDLAAQLWDLGVGPTVLAEPPAPDPFESLWQPLSAVTLWGGEGNAAGQFQRPRDIAVAPDGSVFVADTSNHRIQVFDADGTFKTMWGTFGNRDEGTGGPGAFNEPWGIAVDADGSVYVADTWNHRIQKFTPDGAYVLEWGQFGTDGALTSMWGPRDVATGPDGRVYVADSGNKRILVFEADGTPVRQIGSGGVLDGELDEPVGVAIAADGRVFVADTWNQRVQVFTADGLFLHQWDVQGWFGQSLENKPYLGLDNMGRVFVSDPEGFRILVYDEAGLPQFSFGDFGFDNNTFALPVGVAWDGADSVFVVDSNNHRVMKFQVGVTLPGGEGAAEGG
ncbi:MAG: SMP-30/gluconolactonase/LRE family protein, partial [Anaerolineales bacterium]